MTTLQLDAGARSDHAGATEAARAVHPNFFRFERPLKPERLRMGCGCLGICDECGDVVGVLTICPQGLVSSCFQEDGEEHPSCTRDVRTALTRFRRSSDGPLLDQRGAPVEGWDLAHAARALAADPGARTISVAGLLGRGSRPWTKARVIRVVMAALGFTLMAVLFPVILPFLPFALLVPLLVFLTLLLAIAVTTDPMTERRAGENGGDEREEAIGPLQVRVQTDWEARSPLDSDVFVRVDAGDVEGGEQRRHRRVG